MAAVASPLPLPGQLEPLTGGVRGPSGRSLSPLPIHGRVLAFGPQTNGATTSHTSSPSRRIVASPNVQVHPPQSVTVPISVTLPGPSEASSEDLLKRIDGVVSEMERELSDDLAACVKSPAAEVHHDLHGGSLELIEQEIRCKERRRDACESRQAQLADLRRLVAQSEDKDGRRGPTRRLSILEDEHEQLKKQVEAERMELMKVRAKLQLECDEGLKEAGCVAYPHATQAATNRSRNAAQLQMLQEHLREAEATLERERQQHRMSHEAHAVAGANLRHLEEKSHNILAENQTLRQKIRELELERSVFLENQDTTEEEKQSLTLRIQEVEVERESDMRSLEEAHNRIRDLQSEKEMLSLEHTSELQTSKEEKEDVEKELREAREELTKLQRKLEHFNGGLKAQDSSTMRLSILEGGHEDLKKQVECERMELNQVRANLQVECERRLQEERAWQESMKEHRQQVWAVQEASQHKLREEAQLQVLQERLRTAEQNSKSILEENQTLLQKVSHLEGEHSKLRHFHEKSEEERSSLISRMTEVESQRDNHVGSLGEAEARIRSLQSEKEMLVLELEEMKRSREEKEEAEKQLHEARHKMQVLQQQLMKQEEQVKGFEERHKAQEACLATLQSQLAEEKQETDELRRSVMEAQEAGQKVQGDAQAVLAQLLALQQKNEELQKSAEALPPDSRSARKRQKTRQKSLFAETRSLPTEEDELLGNSTDAFVIQVREAHGGVDRLLEMAGKVHVSTITLQLEHVGEELEEMDPKREIQLERGLLVNELEARRHDLQALKEKVVLQRHLSVEEQDQVTVYIQRDVARCNEELELMQATDVLAKLPEGLIQELIHMMEEGLPGEPGYENGFTPMHWAAQHGRRDLVEFICEKVEQGQDLLRSRDVQGRIPLFFAKRAQRDGLAYHLSRIGGFSDLLIRTSKKRPDIEDLTPAYKKVLEEIEKHSWRAMEWKGGWTMLHWAAKHGKKDLCLYLLNQQANPAEKDDEGRSAVDVARDSNHMDLLVEMQQKATMPRASVSSLAFANPTPKE